MISINLSNAIKQLSNNKSGGPDMYINELFIYGKEALIPHLLTLFNKIFQVGHFPDVWSEGFIIPLHKKGSMNHYDENNY
jgi:hypothetical protein